MTRPDHNRLKPLSKDSDSLKPNDVLRYQIQCHIIRVKWVPCHRGTARPQAADGGDGLQIWRVAEKILNKQSRAAEKGRSSSLVVGLGLTIPHRKRQPVMICYAGPRTCKIFRLAIGSVLL
jgi:hypothetical protein